MNIAPYWARARLDEQGQPSWGPAVAFGWSFVSQAEAEAHALERARSLAVRMRFWCDVPYDEWHSEERYREWLASTPEVVRDLVDVGQLWDEYYSCGRPLKEPILASFGPSDAPWAVVTRNAYGAEVLNTARVMFVDVDLPHPPVDRRSWWDRWVRKVPPPTGKGPGDVEAEIRAAVEAVEGLGLRLYRTANGFRGLVTTRTYEPGSDEAERLLTSLGADPLYRRLCIAQGTYRARLTAKPWRLGLPSPGRSWFPLQDDDRRAAFDAWLAAYQEASRGRAVVRLVGQLGSSEIREDVQQVLELHDAVALGDGELV